MSGRHGHSPRMGWKLHIRPKYLSLPPPILKYAPPPLTGTRLSPLRKSGSSYTVNKESSQLSPIHIKKHAYTFPPKPPKAKSVVTDSFGTPTKCKSYLSLSPKNISTNKSVKNKAEPIFSIRCVIGRRSALCTFVA